jgi:hypothetical protein
MRTLAALCSSLWWVAAADARCQPPQYRAGATFVDTATDLATNISISPQGFTPGRLVCLATSLKDRYRGRTNILVNIFNSPKLTRRSLFVQEYTKEDLKMFSQVHARFVFDADKHEEYIEIMPLGVTPSLRTGPYSTRIDLPAAGAPHCRLEINSRCLLALENVIYPDEALRRKTSGSVTLTATITIAGRVKHVRVAKTDVHPDAADVLLANAAVRNFSSWRLERGPIQEATRITYSYAIDDALPNRGQTQIQWDLPREVRIRRSPQE